MRTVRVYSEEQLYAGTPVSLYGDTVQHIVRVLRMRVGDPIILFDGSGQDFTWLHQKDQQKNSECRIG